MTDTQNLRPIVIDASAFVAHFYVKPDQREAFIQKFNALWQADVAGLQESVNFVFYGWGRDKNEFVAIESWKDDAVTAATRRSDFFQQKVGELFTLCRKPMLLELYTGMDFHRQIFADLPAGESQVHPRAGEICGLII
jgi:quinol monooxygenase YgiN